MSADQLLLIDLSGIGHQIYHVSGNEPDPNYISTQVIARVRALASDHPYAAICCDSGKSFRADIDPTYKANRDTDNRAVLKHQMDLACETLKRDGFPVWAVKGFEADDLIATAVAEAGKIDDTTVLIASADKDLLQLVSDRVNLKKITDGSIMGPAETFDKFGVRPEQMGDYLALVGDKSDNIVGAKGIGGVIAARLLSAHGTLAAIYEKMQHGVVEGLTPALRSSLVEFRDRWPTVAKLIALRTDAPIPFAEIAAERVAAPMEVNYPAMEVGDIFTVSQTNIENPSPLFDPSQGPLAELPPSKAVDALSAATAKVAERIQASAPKASGTLAGQPSVPNGADSGLASKDAVMAAGAVSRLPQSDAAVLVPSTGVSGQLYAGPVDFSQQLEPRSMNEAVQLAQRMFESRLFSAYGTPQAVLATVLAGRELGIPAMASLRAFHIIEGKPTLSAGIIQSLVLKSGKASYFRCSERTATHATFVTKRGDDPEMALTFTVEEARRAFGFTPEMPDKARAELEYKWSRSGWGKNPADNSVARASSKLARLVYPDVVSGLYAPEEME